MNLSDKTKFTKVIVEDIVFLQGEDYDNYIWLKVAHEKLYGDFDTMGYLLQWYNSGKHMENSYDASGINTPFLGYLKKISGEDGYFLFVENTKTGYIGLAKILRFEHSYPEESFMDRIWHKRK